MSILTIATGYYGQHNTLEVEGADLPKVFHYFKEAHPYFDQDVVIIGGKNSAIDAALELAGANVSCYIVAEEIRLQLNRGYFHSISKS